MLAEEISLMFNKAFGEKYRTVIKGAADEPLYRPASRDGGLHTIYYREDFPSSALHEIAHWCIAGRHRRTLDDYGYWYEGARDNKAQLSFEHFEARPQALEWILSVAGNVDFRVSCDNFDVAEANLNAFRRQVKLQVLELLQTGLPARAERLVDLFTRVTGTRNCLDYEMYLELPR